MIRQNVPVALLGNVTTCVLLVTEVTVTAELIDPLECVPVNVPLDKRIVPLLELGNDTEWVLIVFAEVVLATEMKELLWFAFIVTRADAVPQDAV